jgi:DMSO reductase anchor subunit
MVPEAEFSSYYGQPIVNAPEWGSPQIPGYLFLGGLAGASSLLGAGAQLTGRSALERVAKAGAMAAGGLSMAALVSDLGRPARFVNMLRTFKVTSPMSVGSWLLSAYLPGAGVAGFCALTGRLPWLGAAATAAAAVTGPGVAAYTAALVSDTAIPAWHEGFREMPFVFAGSAAMAAGGLGMLAAPAESAPACDLALAGACAELTAAALMERRMGMVAEPYRTGKSGACLKASRALTALGAAGAVLGWRSPLVRRLAGAAFLGASLATRWGVFHAGVASANDPKYTVVPQRERLQAGARAQARADAT